MDHLDAYQTASGGQGPEAVKRLVHWDPLVDIEGVFGVKASPDPAAVTCPLCREQMEARASHSCPCQGKNVNVCAAEGCYGQLRECVYNLSKE